MGKMGTIQEFTKPVPYQNRKNFPVPVKVPLRFPFLMTAGLDHVNPRTLFRGPAAGVHKTAKLVNILHKHSIRIHLNTVL